MPCSCSLYQVTTFSSLLTTSDVKTVAHVLGLPRDRLLLLSLHQFDTEASFYSKIRYIPPTFLIDTLLILAVFVVYGE